jgi:hypothetical protein
MVTKYVPSNHNYDWVDELIAFYCEMQIPSYIVSAIGYPPSLLFLLLGNRSFLRVVFSTRMTLVCQDTTHFTRATVSMPGRPQGRSYYIRHPFPPYNAARRAVSYIVGATLAVALVLLAVALVPPSPWNPRGEENS